MWKRAKETNAVQSVAREQRDKAASGSRALSSPAELLQHAAWEGLDESSRASLLHGFPSFPAAAVSETSNGPADYRSSDVQDWVAGLVANSFQKEAAQIISVWLEDSAPDAHVYVGGDI